MPNFVSNRIVFTQGHYNRHLKQVINCSGEFAPELVSPVPHQLHAQLSHEQLMAFAYILELADLNEDELDELLEPVALYVRSEHIENLAQNFSALDLENASKQALLSEGNRIYLNLINLQAIHHDSWKRNNWGAIEATYTEVNGREIKFYTDWSDMMPVMMAWAKKASLSFEYYALESGFNAWIVARFENGELVYSCRNNRKDVEKLKDIFCADEVED